MYFIFKLSNFLSRMKVLINDTKLNILERRISTWILEKILSFETTYEMTHENIKIFIEKEKVQEIDMKQVYCFLYFYYNFLRKYLSCNIYMSSLLLIFIPTSFYEKRGWDTLYIFWFKVRISHWGITVDAIKFPQISFYDARMDSILNRLIPTSIIKMYTISFLIPLKHLNLLGRPIANVPRYL